MIDVYCDESRPEALYSQNPVDKFMVLGGIWIPREERENVKKAIKELQEKHNVFGEIKWKNISPSKLGFYMELIDLFFENPSIRFRSIIVDTTKVDSDSYHNSDNELGFYKFYYQLLVHWCEPLKHYWIYLDFKKNKQSDRLGTLKRILNNASFSYIKDVQAIESKQSLLIQLSDVLIGSVGYKYNDYCSSDAKLKIIDKIEEHIGLPIQKTNKSARKFNIFEIDLS